MKSAKSTSDAPEYGQLLGEFDKAQSAFKQAKANEKAAKHQLRSVDKDASKAEEQVLRLKLRHAKHVRKACKALVGIVEISIKQWTKVTISHIVVEEAPAPKKRGRQAKIEKTAVETPVEIVENIIVAEAPSPKKRGLQAKAVFIETEEEEGVAGASARLMAEMPVVAKALKAPKVEKAESAPKVEKAAKSPKAEKAAKAPKEVKTAKGVKEAVKAPKESDADKRPRRSSGEAAVEKVAKEAAMKATLAGEDFSIIEGIGPKATSILHENGILTFKELATKGYEELKAMMNANRQFFAQPTTWARQAQLAGDGKMDELEALKKALKNGQKK